MRSNSVSHSAANRIPILLLLLFAGGVLAGCDRDQPSAPNFQGDAKRGKTLIAEYGCGNCHLIPKVAGADGNVGPPLLHIATRVYIAGFMRNSPENMSVWLQDPQRNSCPETPCRQWAYRERIPKISLHFFTR